MTSNHSDDSTRELREFLKKDLPGRTQFPLFVDRSDREKDATAKRIEEDLLFTKLKRWTQGYIVGFLSCAVIVALIWFVSNKG